jgi:DNA-binding MarR family transcriptional regulator
VVRNVSPTDRRSHALRLTDEGISELAMLKDLALQHEADVTTGLSEAEQTQLISLLAKLYGSS